MLLHKSKYIIKVRLISLILIHAIFLSNIQFSHALAPWSASQSLIAKRQIRAVLERTQIVYAGSDKDAKGLLESNNADALLLSHGKYLVTKEVANDDLRLIRAIIHEDVEALMQILHENDRYRYNGVKDLILKYFPPEDSSLPIELYVNHTVARALEWLSVTKDGFILREKISNEERAFIDKIEPIINANKLNYFRDGLYISKEDSKRRRDEIRKALNNGFVFHQAAARLVRDFSKSSPELRSLGAAAADGDEKYEISERFASRHNERARYLANLRGEAPIELQHLQQKLKWPIDMRSAGYLWTLHGERYMSELFGLNLTSPIIHQGIDILADAGTEVRPVKEGTVLYVGPTVKTIPVGTKVYILSNDGFLHVYKHLNYNGNFIKEGQRVTTDQVIGTVQHSPYSTDIFTILSREGSPVQVDEQVLGVPASHLHLEFWHILPHVKFLPGVDPEHVLRHIADLKLLTPYRKDNHPEQKASQDLNPLCLLEHYDKSLGAAAEEEKSGDNPAEALRVIYTEFGFEEFTKAETNVSMLEELGILLSRQEGNQVFYRLNPALKGSNDEETERNIAAVYNIKLKVGRKDKPLDRYEIPEKKIPFVKERMKIEVMNRHLKEALKAQLHDKATIKIWSGYARSAKQKAILQEIRDEALKSGYDIDFGNIGDEAESLKELVDFAISDDGKKENAVVILPYKDDYAKKHMAELKQANVIFMDYDRRLSSADRFFQIGGIVATGVAYVNNNDRAFKNLYRLLTGEEEAFTIEELKKDPVMLKFILEPAEKMDPEDIRQLNECMRELLIRA